MYERLKALYRAGRLTDAQLADAVKRGWITEEQRVEIAASKG